MSNFLCYFDILTSNLEKSKSFYNQLFNWETKPWGTQENYESIKTPQDPQGGIMQSEDEKGILIYIKVDDIEKTLEKTKQLGGNVILGKTQIPNVGWYALIADPDGNKFGIFNQK